MSQKKNINRSSGNIGRSLCQKFSKKNYLFMVFQKKEIIEVKILRISILIIEKTKN